MSNKVTIDFQIYESQDPKQIIVLDTSNWAHLESKTSVIEVITPGEKNPVGYYFSKKNFTILNSNNLGLTCGDCKSVNLPDGIYEITVKASPDKFNKTRYYFKTTLIQLELDELLLEQYWNDASADEISNILKYKDMLRVAEAFVRKGHKKEAQDILTKVQKFTTKCRRKA